MADETPSRYQRCFISAPFGLELEVLPALLAERGIFWEWAKDSPPQGRDTGSGMENSDFVIVVLNGTRADYRAAFEAGIAVGLRKPVLLIQTNARALPLDFRRFTTVKTSLSNRDALGFHLDLFLAAPVVSPDSDDVDQPKGRPTDRPSRSRDLPRYFSTELERRAYDAVLQAGGTAVSEPRPYPETRFRPDLLAWLGNLDSELLDPVVIEVRTRVERHIARRLEEQLLRFMQMARIRTALVLTASPPPDREQQLSPNVFWLTIDKFEELAITGRLGAYVKDTRNRSLHGTR